MYDLASIQHRRLFWRNLLPEKMTQTFITTETIMDTDSTMVNITHRFVHTWFGCLFIASLRILLGWNGTLAACLHIGESVLSMYDVNWKLGRVKGEVASPSSYRLPSFSILVTSSIQVCSYVSGSVHLLFQAQLRFKAYKFEQRNKFSRWPTCGIES